MSGDLNKSLTLGFRMKSLRFHDIQDLRLEDAENPVPISGEIRLKNCQCWHLWVRYSLFPRRQHRWEKIEKPVGPWA